MGRLIERYFTQPGETLQDVLASVPYDKRDIKILHHATGSVVFEQKDVEAPEFWSDIAVKVVASKYFYGKLGAPERETSVKQMIERVVSTVVEWAIDQKYFEEDEEASTFEAELGYVLLYQYGSFNSPVWFNLGCEELPQCSACFILSIDDHMESILGVAKIEGMIFKKGSGAGKNLYPLRSSFESLPAGGKSSGPVSFMKGYDAFAGVISSGGRVRRAAKMEILNYDHPDILEFICCKANEEKKAHALIDAGYDSSIDGDAYSSVFFQNSNLTVRVTDVFMKRALEGWKYETRYITTGEVHEELNAADVLHQIAEAAWQCGDPGLQFDTTINDWNTCSVSGRINASNPCSEFCWLDDSACNLASVNAKAVLLSRQDESLDIEGFQQTVRLFIIAQDVIVDRAGYPTPEIATNSQGYRPLGLGYTNLGAFLMSLGIPYDSEEGRMVAGALTSLMTGTAYYTSTELAELLGSYAGLGGYGIVPSNYESHKKVLEQHFRAVVGLSHRASQSYDTPFAHDLLESSQAVWKKVRDNYEKVKGIRNAQVTLLAPSGTISFMMDCDTTGIEPELALVKTKNLVGGGTLVIMNGTVHEALQRLGYAGGEATDILGYIETEGTIEGAPGFKDEHLPVFDCAFKPSKGTRFIEPMGHLKMMAAVQPFLSGGISKTVNIPNDATVDDVKEIFIKGWEQNLKSITVYRDGCKKVQPLELVKQKEEPTVRRRLKDTRNSLTHKFSVAGHEGYITVGQYEDGSPGEIFIVMSKGGSTISGLMDTIATQTSILLQYGVPLEVLVNKFTHVRFEPSGFTANKDIPIAKSLVDYIFRWLEIKFGDGAPKVIEEEDDSIVVPVPEVEKEEVRVYDNQSDALLCRICGAIMERVGTCYRCPDCGGSEGCS